MSRSAKAALGVLMLAGVSLAATGPASAYAGISFGFGGSVFGDPCDYYDYYDQPPPWGLPPDYCDYPVFFEPVFVDGMWYRGPIYYRWNHGRRIFWLHGGWRADEWRGARPNIIWQNRGGWNHGFRPGMNHIGPGPRPWIGHPMGGPPRFGGGTHFGHR
jgi:hypothetical protein